MNRRDIAKTKKLFKNIVNNIIDCTDTITKDISGNITEKGMHLSENYTAMIGVDGVVRIYGTDPITPIIQFSEESELPLALKELFEFY